MSEKSLRAKTTKGLLWSSVERFSNQGINFLFTILIARILSPKDYGIIGMLAVFMAICTTFINSGFGNALVRKPDRTEVDNSTAFYFNIGIGFVAYFIMFVCAPYIASFYKMPILIWVTRIQAINLILGSFSIVQFAMLTIQIDFKTQAKVSIISTFISGIIGLMFAYLGYGVWALVVQSVLFTLSQTLLAWFFVQWRPTEKFSLASFKQLFGYGSKLLFAGLIETIYANIYVLVIGKIFKASSLGLYSRAEQLVQFPSSNLTSILQRVSFPVLSKIQDDIPRLRGSYRRLLKMSAFVIFPLMILLAMIAHPLVNIILGEKWLGCVVFLQIICFDLIWYPIHAINLNLLQVTGRSDLFLRVEIIKKVVGISTLVLTIPMGLTMMCYGRVLSSMICLIINTYYTGKLIDVGFFKQINDLSPKFFTALFAGLCSYLLLQCFDNAYIQVFVGVGSTTFIYVVIAYYTKSSELHEVFDLIKNRK